jgi:spermidine/putrescine transport system ATP-binding protein
MNAGRVEQGGTQLELYLRPSTPFVAEFLGNNNCLRGVVTESADAKIAVRVGDHVFTSLGPRRLEPGTRVLAYVRPEEVSVLAHGAQVRRNMLAGVVHRIVFDGSTIHLHVDTAVARLVVEVGGSERLDLMSGTGSQVKLGFDTLTIIPD